MTPQLSGITQQHLLTNQNEKMTQDKNQDYINNITFLNQYLNYMYTIKHLVNECNLNI